MLRVIIKLILTFFHYNLKPFRNKEGAKTPAEIIHPSPLFFWLHCTPEQLHGHMLNQFTLDSTSFKLKQKTCAIICRKFWRMLGAQGSFLGLWLSGGQGEFDRTKTVCHIWGELENSLLLVRFGYSYELPKYDMAVIFEPTILALFKKRC